MLERLFFENRIHQGLEIHPACAILGPRQCGKTTLAHHYIKSHPGPVHFFDLENPNDLNALSSPSLTLEPLDGLIVIDEIQRRPELFPYLRVLCDYSDKKFLILGSASRDLIHQSSESLAGRISYIELTPFNSLEVSDMHLHWIRGGFPKSYLAPSASASEQWRSEYIKTYLERDLSWLGFSTNVTLMESLWFMVAHYHGQTLNYSDIARSLAVTDKTIRRYVEILQGSFMVRLLRPWFENISKRQVKSPKLYIRDSGILHSLLDIPDTLMLRHPKVGASWEGYALEETIRRLALDERRCYFWSTQGQAEIDLFCFKEGKRLGFEFKYSEAPRVTASMHTAMKDLMLDTLTIVVPGDKTYPLEKNITVTGLARLR